MEEQEPQSGLEWSNEGTGVRRTYYVTSDGARYVSAYRIGENGEWWVVILNQRLKVHTLLKFPSPSFPAVREYFDRLPNLEPNTQAYYDNRDALRDGMESFRRSELRDKQLKQAASQRRYRRRRVARQLTTA